VHPIYLRTGHGPTASTRLDGKSGVTGDCHAPFCGSPGVRFPRATRHCKNSTRHGRHRQVSFDFLGHTFKPRSAQRKDGTMFTTFTPAISGKATAIRQQIRRMRFHLRSDLSFSDIAKMINAKAGAWAAYFGRFRPSETARVLFHIDRYLLRWARRKYKHLRRAPRRASRTLAAIKKSRPGLLAHWRWEVRTRTAAVRAG
jgi:RNA-directed DNA polymerase